MDVKPIAMTKHLHELEEGKQSEWRKKYCHIKEKWQIQ